MDVASGFFPQYGRNANAVLNIDSQGGGALTLQADLDKDIDSVTAFPPVGGYASNYSIQTGVGPILSGNNSRLGWGITNYGTGNIYLKFGLSFLFFQHSPEISLIALLLNGMSLSLYKLHKTQLLDCQKLFDSFSV